MQQYRRRIIGDSRANTTGPPAVVLIKRPMKAHEGTVAELRCCALALTAHPRMHAPGECSLLRFHLR